MSAGEGKSKLVIFEQAVLPYLPAAYNLARWLAHNETDAEDIVQEAYLRAFRFFGGFRGGDARAWLLTIVRNVFLSWVNQKGSHGLAAISDDELEEIESDAPDPETTLIRGADSERLRQAVEQLPVEYREVIVLRELEELSYKEIAEVAGIPLGTVMSRLARARKRLHDFLTTGSTREYRNEVR